MNIGIHKAQTLFLTVVQVRIHLEGALFFHQGLTEIIKGSSTMELLRAESTTSKTKGTSWRSLTT